MKKLPPWVLRIPKLHGFFKHRLYIKEHFQAVMVDLLKCSANESNNRLHIERAAAWLLKAHQQAPDGGLSRSYSFAFGWRPSHIGCALYSSEALWEAGEYLNVSTYREGALEVAEWACQYQLPNGAFPKNTIADEEPRILSTAEALLGLIAAYEHSNLTLFLERAQAAGRWLCEEQDQDGAWRKNNLVHKAIHVTYHSKTAYALYRLFEITGIKRYRECSTRYLNWAAMFQNDNGYLLHASLNGDRNPQSHLMAYALRGFVEVGMAIQDEKFLSVADRALEKAAHLFLRRGYLPATLNAEWDRFDDFYQAQVKRSCVCGDAEFSIMWLKMWVITNKQIFRDASIRMTAYLREIHRRRYISENLQGGLPGCDKTYGRYYEQFAFPNWAVKFFVEAILVEEKYTIKKASEIDEFRSD